MLTGYGITNGGKNMPAKKTTKQKPLSKSLLPTEKERAKLKKSAEADLKRHGFRSVEELTAYYDSKRGY